MTNAEARFNKSLRPRKPEGSLGRTAQDGHLDSHTAPELCPEFVNVFPLCRPGSFVFSLVAAAFSIPTGTCVSGRKKQCCAKYTCIRDFKSHFRRDFLAYCTSPVSVHLAMVRAGCSFDSFSIFSLSLKHQQHLMKIMFCCIHFPVWPPPPPPPPKKKNKEKKTNKNGILYR